MLRVAKALEVVVLVHGLILGKTSCFGEVTSIELGPSEGMSWRISSVLQATAMCVQGMIQVNRLVTLDVSRGLCWVQALLTMPVHCKYRDGISMGVHASPGGICSYLAGPVHSARIMNWQDHPLLPAAHWVGGFQTYRTWVSLLLFWMGRKANSVSWKCSHSAEGLLPGRLRQ